MRLYLLFLIFSLPLQALTIKVDYRYDTNGFFDAPGSKAAIEAAADRFSRIIDQKLLAVDVDAGAQFDARFQFFHPGTGDIHTVSSADSAGTDFLASSPAKEYLGGLSLDEDVWILYVGGRPLASAALGGPIGAQIRFPVWDDDSNSFLNRGFNVGADSLTVLGGAVSFDTNTNWNFSLGDPGGTVNGIDLYSMALHEIGHALGLNSQSCPEWEKLVSSGRYVGSLAIEAYNKDNGTALAALEIESPSNFHWDNNTYESEIFQFGSPNTSGAVAKGELQDLLMETAASFTNAVRRFEVTNVEIGGLRDIGWSVITEDPPPPPEIPVIFERSQDGSFALAFPSENGVTYAIQTSIDGLNWQNVVPSLIGDGSTLAWKDGQEGFTDPNGNAVDLSGKYYRIVEN